MSVEVEGSTRERLLDVALNLFAQNGFAGTSMRMIARGAELRESSIYNHFTGKDELYREVAAQWGPAEFVDRLQSKEYKDLVDDPAAFLRLCAKHLIDRWMDPREHLFASLIAKEGPEGEGFQRYYQALFVDELDLLERYFAHFAKKHGMVAPNPRETARMLIAGFVHIRRELFSAPAMPQRTEVQKAMRRYITNFMATVLPASE
ncbi:MAG: TetR/AcrR family transcriptional regulator [Terricaulis sp.]